MSDSKLGLVVFPGSEDAATLARGFDLASKQALTPIVRTRIVTTESVRMIPMLRPISPRRCKDL